MVPLLVRLPDARVGYVPAPTGAQCYACCYACCYAMQRACLHALQAPSRASPCAFGRRAPPQAKATARRRPARCLLLVLRQISAACPLHVWCGCVVLPASGRLVSPCARAPAQRHTQVWGPREGGH